MRSMSSIALSGELLSSLQQQQHCSCCWIFFDDNARSLNKTITIRYLYWSQSTRTKNPRQLAQRTSYSPNARQIKEASSQNRWRGVRGWNHSQGLNSSRRVVIREWMTKIERDRNSSHKKIGTCTWYLILLLPQVQYEAVKDEFQVMLYDGHCDGLKHCW